jgi:hypothetical protein
MLLAALLVPLTGSDSRAQFGDTAATALEQLVSRLYVEGRVVWRDSAWLERRGLPPAELLLPGFLQRPSGRGFVFATGLEFPAELRVAAEAVRSFRSLPQGIARTQLAVFYSDLQGNVSEYASGTLDGGTEPTQCLNVQLIRADGARWPRLRVRYRQYYVEATTSTEIEWMEIADPPSMKAAERLPLRLAQHSRDGTSVTVTLKSHRKDPGTIEITSSNGGWPLVYACREPCIVTDSVVILHKWR